MLSLVLPLRDWPADRIEACLASFLRLKSKALAEIVVVDFGSAEPVVLPRLKDRRLRLVRVEAERWSLAEAINVGVVAATNPVIVKTDADIVIARESGPALDRAVAEIASGGMAIGVVQATDLPEGIGPADAVAADTASLVAVGRLRPRWGQGGLCLFSAQAWNEIGGFESRFHGWGNEDNDFSDRMRRSGRRVRWLSDIRIFHVWHPPSYAAKHIIKSREANRELYLTDKSTLRGIRFRHSRRAPVHAPAVVNRPRPLVTVAIASTERPGRQRMILEAIKGFTGQIDNDFEILIADNGSPAGAADALRSALSKRRFPVPVRILELPTPSIPAARNRLTDEAEGRYICIADDDDIPLPARLADHLAAFSRDPVVHGSHGGWIDFDEVTGLVETNTGGERNLTNFLFGPGRPSAHPASLFRTDVMRAVRYDESIRFGSDFDLAARMANLGLRVEHTGSYVVLRRFHQGNVTISGLGGQLSVAAAARTRIKETLGPWLETRLREALKSTKVSIPCANGPATDDLRGMLPGYTGTWRLLVPLAALGGRPKASRPMAIVSPDAAAQEAGEVEAGLNGRDHALDIDAADEAERPESLPERAAALAGMVDGEVAVIDAGIDPRLFYVSKPIKGIARVRKLRAAIEQKLDLSAEIVPAVEFENRNATRFDWSSLPKEARAAMLVSHPMHELDEAIAALSMVPANTALRAMTSIVADFNCTARIYRLITAPIRTEGGPARARKLLERQTGEKFSTVAEAGLIQ